MIPLVPETPSTVTVYAVSGASGDSGLTKARRPPSAATTSAVTSAPDALSVIVSEFTLVTSTGCENRIDTVVLTGTFRAPAAGIEPDTSGDESVALWSFLLFARLKLWIDGS